METNPVSLRPLKGRVSLDSVFKEGLVYRGKNILLLYNRNGEPSFLDAAVSVPKNSFSRAVDRNRIKRQLRSALRSLKDTIPFSGKCVFIYTGSSIPLNTDVIKDLKGLFKLVSF